MSSLPQSQSSCWTEVHTEQTNIHSLYVFSCNILQNVMGALELPLKLPLYQYGSYLTCREWWHVQCNTKMFQKIISNIMAGITHSQLWFHELIQMHALLRIFYLNEFKYKLYLYSVFQDCASFRLYFSQIKVHVNLWKIWFFKLNPVIVSHKSVDILCKTFQQIFCKVMSSWVCHPCLVSSLIDKRSPRITRLTIQCLIK